MIDSSDKRRYTGILLAAGQGRRFDPTGKQSKLLQILPNGETVVAAAARNLHYATNTVVAVVSSTSSLLAAHLSSQGYDVTECANSEAGMAASLVHALQMSRQAPGWVIALGDMPFVQAETIEKLINALMQGADIALPVYRGRRGNPVAFSCRHLEELLQLHGDIGGRTLIQSYPVYEVVVNDPGIHRDIDLVPDLQRLFEY